ncbi:MAG: DAK2 domain-containing protein [Faecousia sp.]
MLRDRIDGQNLQKMLIAAAAVVENHKQQINELNVFPVPDGDTGTNMSMTLLNAAGELQKLNAPTLTKVADTAASAMLRGARGNSGVILSLLFRGISKSLKGMEECDGVQLAHALQGGVEAAYKAVMKPTEGTILTVARVSAENACAACDEDNCFESILAIAVNSASDALAQTIHQNPVLEKAGVVDAGGKGWLYVLEAMLSVCRGEEIALSSVEAPVVVKEQADFTEFDSEEITFAFDTVFIVRKAYEDIDLMPLRRYLDSIGDSIVIGEDDESFKVHVHTNTPGDALNESQKYGTLELCKIENMQMQHDDLASGRQARSTDDLEQIEQELEAPAKEKTVIAVPEKKFGMVTVCAGDGLAAVFSELGADQIIEGGQTMNPSTQDILEKINATPAEIVFVFPNNKNIIMAAEQTVALTEKKVIVIPSKTIPQGISAMLVFDPFGDEAQNVEAMNDAIGQVVTMQLTYAARDSDFGGASIHAGEYLALDGGSLFGNDTDLFRLVRKMAEKLGDEGYEFITIYYGADINQEQANQAASIFTNFCPDAEVSVVYGGQPVYYFLISAE